MGKYGLLGQDFGEKERSYMKKKMAKITYTDEPIKIGKRLADDFLPSPAELAARERTIKVTIGLSERSIEFFKREALENDVGYQSMIRNLLDVYVATNA